MKYTDVSDSCHSRRAAVLAWSPPVVVLRRVRGKMGSGFSGRVRYQRTRNGWTKSAEYIEMSGNRGTATGNTAVPPRYPHHHISKFSRFLVLWLARTVISREMNTCESSQVFRRWNGETARQSTHTPVVDAGMCVSGVAPAEQAPGHALLTTGRGCSRRPRACRRHGRALRHRPSRAAGPREALGRRELEARLEAPVPRQMGRGVAPAAGGVQL